LARSTLRYVLPLAKLSLLAGLALTGCGGDASSTMGPAPIPPETSTVAAAPVGSAPTRAPVPAPAPAPAPPPPPRRVPVTARVEGGLVGGVGCVSMQADSPSRATRCAYPSVTIAADEGTRGSVTAVPGSGYQFIGWASSSSDCPGETTNPCSFAFDRSKTMVARFAWGS
jgi:hypothetical protein